MIDAAVRSSRQAMDGAFAGSHLAGIAEGFELGGSITSIEALGHGNVNDTYLVRLEGTPERRFVLQRINTRVFPKPERLMANMAALGDHLQGHRLAGPAPIAGRRWEVPRLIPVRQGAHPWVEDPQGHVWRMSTFIDEARSFETVESDAQARELGFGLGTFHSLLNDLPIERLAVTLEGFHITPTYLAAYGEASSRALADSTVSSDPELAYCRNFVALRADQAGVLETAKAQGTLRLRPIHGDPKVNNVMVDLRSGQAVGLVDLDTVQPGLIHYDIGDCCRSGCNPLGEETGDWRAVRFDPGRCEAILEGYFSAARSFLTDNDIAFLYDAIRLIAFELGLRFLTDHLMGNVYFKVRHPRHNLDRALVQFRLTESIEEQEGVLRALIERLR